MSETKRIIALGFFDGVHLGHRAILRKTTALAHELSMRSAALSFSAPPKRLGDGAPPPLLTSYEQRVSLMRALGIEDALALVFDQSMRNMEPEAFVRDMLIKGFGARGLVCGHSFRFGRAASGDIHTLRALCAQFGLRLALCPEVLDGDDVISSTLIRRLLLSGDLARANRLLGRPYALPGAVFAGLFTPDPGLAPVMPGRYAVRLHGRTIDAHARTDGAFELLAPNGSGLLHLIDRQDR